MIAKNELMIGCLVAFGTEEQIILEVETIGELGINRKEEYDEDMMSEIGENELSVSEYKYEDLSPINIDERFLITIGFKKGKGYNEFYSKGELEIARVQSGHSESNVWRVSINENEYEVGNPIFYIHELQILDKIFNRGKSGSVSIPPQIDRGLTPEFLLSLSFFEVKSGMKDENDNPYDAEVNVDFNRSREELLFIERENHRNRIAVVLGRFKDQGLEDNEYYAEVWIRENIGCAYLQIPFLKSQLKQKGFIMLCKALRED